MKYSGPLLVLLLGSTLMAGTLPPDPEEAAYPAIERFIQALELVRENHPDVDRLTYDRLINHALEGMFGSLDPHSSFIYPEMMEAMRQKQDLDPEVEGLGLSLAQTDDGIHISAMGPQGPAADASIRPGSKLLAINGNDLQGVPLAKALEMLQARPGETVKLLIRPPDAPRPTEVVLPYLVVESRSVAESRILDKAKGSGYLRLAQFGAGCARETEAALDDLEDSGMKSLVLDLRENGGGDLHETVSILGLFVPPKTKVVSIRRRDGNPEETLETPERQRRKREYPIVVLVDRMSASASELTAGALQDLKRAKVIGETSYGKGSVQNIIPAGGGTALRLTIATYHTPSGRTPHRVGITPDIVVPIPDSDLENFRKRCRIDSLAPEERKRIEAWEDPVLAAALKAL